MGGWLGVCLALRGWGYVVAAMRCNAMRLVGDCQRAVEGNEAGWQRGLVGGLKCYKLLQMVAYINLRSMLDCSKLKLDP